MPVHAAKLLYQCNCSGLKNSRNIPTSNSGFFYSSKNYSIVYYYQCNVQSCKRLCMLSEDGIFYMPQNDIDAVHINYYCDNNTDPKCN